MSPFPFTSTLDELYELLDKESFGHVIEYLNQGETIIFNHSGNSTSLRFGTSSSNGIFRTLNIDPVTHQANFEETFNPHPTSSIHQREAQPETV